MTSTHIDIDRRRHIMQKVWRKVEGWQYLYMTCDINSPSSCKGRYLAAKEFHDWLSNGGDLEKANEFLAERSKYWGEEEKAAERLEFSAELAARIENGWSTKESLAGFAHLFTGDDVLSDEEKQRIEFLIWQFKGSQTEIWHLKRLLEK